MTNKRREKVWPIKFNGVMFFMMTFFTENFFFFRLSLSLHDGPKRERKKVGKFLKKSLLKKIYEFSLEISSVNF